MKVYFYKNNAYNSVVVTDLKTAKFFYRNGELTSIDKNGDFKLIDLCDGRDRSVLDIIADLKKVEFYRNYEEFVGDFELKYELIANDLEEYGYLIYEDIEEKYITLLKTCTNEASHEEADSIIYDFLKEIGYDRLAETYKHVPKWFS